MIGSKYHHKRAIIGQPMKHHLNGVSLACRRWPNIECWLDNFVIFQRVRTSIANKPDPLSPASGSGHVGRCVNLYPACKELITEMAIGWLLLYLDCYRLLCLNQPPDTKRFEAPPKLLFYVEQNAYINIKLLNLANKDLCKISVISHRRHFETLRQD